MITGDLSNTRLLKTTPVFLVSDVAETIRWYREKLGFEGSALPERPPHFFGILTRDDVEIFLQQLKGYRKPDLYAAREGGVWDAYLRMEGVRAFAEALSPEVEVVEPLRRQPYGQTEEVVRDLNGYVLVFAEEE